MKLNIPIEVVFNDLNSMIDELGKLQKYKLGEGDYMTLVDVCDVADILMRHVKAREAKRGTHWIPCSEGLPKVKPCKTADADYEISEAVFVTRDFWHNTKVEIGYYEIDDTHRKYWVDEYGEVLCGVVAWMPLPKPYGGESDSTYEDDTGGKDNE